MRKNLIKLGIVLSCAMPYGFWAMYGDSTYGSRKNNLPWIVLYTAVSVIAAKTKNVKYLLLGNVLSFLCSYYFLLEHYVEEFYGWYFKPFSAAGFLRFITVIMLVYECILILVFRKRKAE